MKLGRKDGQKSETEKRKHERKTDKKKKTRLKSGPTCGSHSDSSTALR